MRIALEKVRYFLTTLMLFVFAPAVMALEQQTLPFHETLECPSENLYLEGSVRLQYQYVESNGGSTWFFSASGQARPWVWIAAMSSC